MTTSSVNFLNKRSIFAAVFLVALSLLLANFTLAAPSQTVTFDPRETVGTDIGQVRSFGAKIADIFGTIVLALSVIMIIWAAFQYVLSGTGSFKPEDARKTLTYALVGVGIAVLAFVLPRLIQALIKETISG